ncbi:MAG TPA: SpoIIE family protein phosphatase [Solirubrobacteraceae bacterium]|jgi:PAS domain S-box-containing protein|nr:SpoIIE family protein phosphatase [Solirubrobacteraceae bacterium]
MHANLTELILDRAHSAVVSMDEQGAVTYWNPSAQAMFGVSQADALGRAVADLIVPERFRSAHLNGLRRLLDTGEGAVLDRRIEVAGLRADGTEFPAEMTISAFRDDGPWTFHAFIQDISERKRNEEEHRRLLEELRRALHGSERRFDAIVGSLSDAVTIRDRQHRFVYANAAALAHLGFATWEELQATAPAQIMADYAVWNEDGSDVTMDDIPSVRILRGESADPLVIRTINRETGEQHWNLLKAAPLLDESGEIEATIMIIEDVTEQKRAERQNAFLAQAGAVLASSLDYEQTLRNVAELVVPDIADWCAVDLIDEDGDRHRVAMAHKDPDMLRRAEQLREYEPERLDPAQGLGRVLHTGEPLLYPQIPDEMVLEAAVDDRHLELLRAVGMRSLAIVPMTIAKRRLGAMTFVNGDSGRALDRFDLALAEQVAGRAAVAIENARLYGERSAIAHTLQQSLLPEQLPRLEGYELASVYIPAFESTDVGGDFYDVWRVADGWMIVIGDVTGKGVKAAALTSLVRHTMRTASEFESSPARLLARVDNTLQGQPTRSVCTALCMRLELDRATLAVGGHPLPVALTRDGVTELGEYGPLLGGFANASWSDSAVDIEPDSAIVMYTDGVTDAMGDDGTRYGSDRLHEMLGSCRGRPAADVITSLATALEVFQSGTHADDTAALALRRLPTAPALTVVDSGRALDGLSHDRVGGDA